MDELDVRFLSWIISRVEIKTKCRNTMSLFHRSSACACVVCILPVSPFIGCSHPPLLRRATSFATAFGALHLEYLGTVGRRARDGWAGLGWTV